MNSAPAIRVEVEATLARRVPAALTLKIKQAPELFSTGIVEVDAMLGGGIPRPMTLQRAELDHLGVLRAAELKAVPDGTFVRIAGAVIARQRPGTAAGFIFLSNEDETGISNAIISPQLYEQNRATVTREKFLLVEGVLQNQDVINVRASAVKVVDAGNVDVVSHDFH